VYGSAHNTGAKPSPLFWTITLAVGTTVWAQGLTGSISGLVKDPNGEVVPKAKVTVKNAATNAEARTQTDETGFYRALNLLPGDYIVSAEAEGFRRATTTTPQPLTIAQALRVDLNLEVGQVTEVVEVQETARQVNTEDAQLGVAITAISTLPVISGAGGRDVLNLAGFMPGVSMTPPAGAPTNDIGPFAVNGQRTQANNYTLDGLDSNDLAINIPDALGQISPNALAEFRIVTGEMKAEYGRNGGAVVEAITRSGGNAWHGIAEEAAFFALTMGLMSGEVWHGMDQVLNLARNFWPPFVPGMKAPVQTETLPRPTLDRVRPYDPKRFGPLWPQSAQQNPKQPIAALQPWPLGTALQN
jgi:hypothetical protein